MGKFICHKHEVSGQLINGQINIVHQTLGNTIAKPKHLDIKITTVIYSYIYMYNLNITQQTAVKQSHLTCMAIIPE